VYHNFISIFLNNLLFHISIIPAHLNLSTGIYIPDDLNLKIEPPEDVSTHKCELDVHKIYAENCTNLLHIHFSITKGGEDVPVAVVPPLPAYYPPPTCEGTTDSTGCNAYSDYCEWIGEENRCQSREGFGQISVIGCERFSGPPNPTGCRNDLNCEWAGTYCRPKGGYSPNPVTGGCERHSTNPFDSTGCINDPNCEWAGTFCRPKGGYSPVTGGCERHSTNPFDSTGCINDPNCEWAGTFCRPKGGYGPFPNPVNGFFPVTSIPCEARHPTNSVGCDNDQGCQWLEQEYRCAARDGNPFEPTTDYPKYPGGPNPPSQEEIYCNSISVVEQGDLSKCYSDDRCGLIFNPYPNPLINNGRSLCTAWLGCGAYLYAPLGTGMPSCTNDPRCRMSYFPYGCFDAY